MQQDHSRIQRQALKASIAIAVSGGSDSTALLLLAADALPGNIHALSVDHGLRAESADEAAAVAALCARLQVPHTILQANLSPGPGEPARARAARYALLHAAAVQVGAAAVLTGHTADDQAETLVRRLRRNADVASMIGIPPVTYYEGTPFMRPLLACTRAQLRAWLQARGQGFVDDPSNAASERGRMRASGISTALRERLCLSAAAAWALRTVRAAGAAEVLRRYAERRAEGVYLAFAALEQPDADVAVGFLLHRIGGSARPPAPNNALRALLAFAHKGKGPLPGGCVGRRCAAGVLLTPERRRGVERHPLPLFFPACDKILHENYFFM